MRKRLLVLMYLTLSLAVTSAISTTAFADETNPLDVPPEIITSGDYNYVINDDKETVTIVEYTGEEDVIDIPPVLDGYTVSEIGYQAFTYKEMKSLSFPGSIRSIGSRSFEYCVVTDSLQLPSGAVLFDDSFAYSELPAELVIPAGTTVEKGAFSYCDTILQVVVGPYSVIRSRAFGYCDNLGLAVFGNDCLLEEKAFEYCRVLGKVIFCGETEADEEAFSYCGDYQTVSAEESEFSNWADFDPDLKIEKREEPKTPADTKEDTQPGAEHSITYSGDDHIIMSCPDSARAGEKVDVFTWDIFEGGVELEVNGEDIGHWMGYGIYSFTMPDEDVEIRGRVGTEE